MEAVGEAIHGFFAADRDGLEGEERLLLARSILERWGVAGALESGQLLVASDRLRHWAEQRWPGATWRREWPVRHRLDNGTVVHGFVDLVLELPEEFVAIDHKSYPGSIEKAIEMATEYGGQVQAYVDAVRGATGKRGGGGFIHLPMSGVMVELGVRG